MDIDDLIKFQNLPVIRLNKPTPVARTCPEIIIPNSFISFSENASIRTLDDFRESHLSGTPSKDANESRYSSELVKRKSAGTFDAKIYGIAEFKDYQAIIYSINEDNSPMQSLRSISLDYVSDVFFRDSFLFFQN